MAKQSTTIRLESDTIDFLNQKSLQLGLHHPLGASLPNTSKIITEVIDTFIRLDGLGISLSALNDEQFIKQVLTLKNSQA